MLSKVSPYRTISNQNGVARIDVGGSRHPTVNQWKQSWNGNRFAPPSLTSVLYLPGHPGTGSTITDFSGNSNHGTLSLPVWRQLPSGLPYLDFDGVDDNVNCGSGSSIDNIWATGGTALAWIKADSDGEGDFGRIFWKATLNLSGWTLFVADEAAGKVKVDFYTWWSGLNGAWYATNTCVTVGVWTLVAITYSSALTTNDAILYINGVSEPVTETSTPAETYDSDAGDELYIGNRIEGTNTFDGGIALPRLFNAILTAPQITNIYKQEKSLFGVT